MYYPTSPIIVHSILHIATQLKMHENDLVLREAVVSMKSKYLKYWREIRYLYAFAFVLDLRAKIGPFGSVLDLLNDATGLDYTNYFVKVRSWLYEVYQRYENKFRGVRSQRPPVAPTSSGKTSMWGTIFGASSSRSRSSSSSSSAPAPAQPRPTRSGELSTYLDSDTVDFNAEGFNILQWWQAHKLTYHVLSILARDVILASILH